MATMLDYSASTNSLTVSGTSGVIPIAGSGIDNNFTVPQTFKDGINTSTISASGAMSVSGTSSLQSVTATTGAFTGEVSTATASSPGAVPNLGQTESLFQSSQLTVSSTTVSGSVTASASDLTGQYFADGATQTAAFTVTTDTAVNILAAMPNAVVGTAFKWRFINNDQSATSYAGTLAGGTDVTVGSILPNPAVPKGGYADYVFTFTAIGSTPTLTVECVGGNSAGLL